MSANLLSLGAVDFGIIVDGAVIMVEHVAHRLAGVTGRRQTRSTVLEAAEEVARPTLFALLIIIVAYIPIFTLQRVEGRIFAPMANTVCAALVGALVFSFTLVPLLSFLVLRGKTGGEQTPIEAAALRVYRPALGWALDHRRAVVAATAAVLAVGMWLFTRLGTEFLPELNEGALWVTATLPPSVSLNRAAQLVVPHVRDTLLSFPEVRGVLGQLGGPEDGTDWKTANNLEYFVDLKPREEWPSGVTSEGLIAAMNARLTEIPGVDFNFSEPIKDNIEENISGLKGQLAVKVFGDDLEGLHRAAADVKRVLEGVRGVADLAVVQAAELPQVHIRVDRQAVARYGLNVGGRDLGGFVKEAQRKVAERVQLPPNAFITWGGEFENQRRAMARLAFIIPLSIVLILVILVRTFGSFACALLILATIPFALVGGVAGLDVARLHLSVSACIGFIALMGQVVLNGVVLVSQINALRVEGMSLRAAVEAGAARRLRAVLMTALLAALGLLPAALSTQIGSETQRPLAVVVIR